MATFLFDKIIFGPVSSRRLGQSLGINLLPPDKKICNFNCIYCECGLTDGTRAELPSRFEVKKKLEESLLDFSSQGKAIDSITFAGNGEPTLHHDFCNIIADTVELRNTYFPRAKIALLTNATTIASPHIQTALKQIDQSILKLDSVNPRTVEILNCPLGEFNLSKIINTFQKLDRPIIQTLFLRGNYKGKLIDNTTEIEVAPWLATLQKIQPELVMVYTISRDTPYETLEKIPPAELDRIATRVEQLGIRTQIST
jgi:wyosine [tRNA(Phe)-imidazoG37] synthetase (radical SAM superfamily)